MSSPTIDRAEIERRKEAALERARQEKIRQIRKATDELYAVINEISVLCKSIQSDYARETAYASEKNEMQMTVQNIDKIKDMYISLLNNLSITSIPSEPQEILKLAASIKTKALSIKNEYDNQILAEFERIELNMISEQTLNELSFFSSNMNSSKTNKNIGFTDFSFEKTIIMDSNNISKTEKEKIKATIDEITVLVNADYISTKDKKELVKLAKELAESTHISNASATNAYANYCYAKPGIVARIEEFEDLYKDYMAEYTFYIETLNKSQRNKLPIIPKGKNMFPSASELNKELKTLKNLSCEVNKQGYIREQLDEVLAIFGYGKCEDIIFDTYQKGSHYICPITDKQNTGLHIHLSGSKQLMMEVVGLGSEKNNDICNDSPCITAIFDNDEAAEIVEVQGKFCEIHLQITEELRKRGIILNSKIQRKPDYKKCKKIINLTTSKSSELCCFDEFDIINNENIQRRNISKIQKELSLR